MNRKRIALICGLLIVAIVGIAIVRTIATQHEAPANSSLTPFPFNDEGVIQRFSGAVRIATVSQPQKPPDADALTALRNYLEQSFPLTHLALQREVVHTGALLYTWQGSDSSLPPIVFMGHLDVVPIDPATRSRWLQDPFGGTVTHGTIPGVSGDVALISVAEKGFMSLALTVTAPGGHSSRPPKESAIGILSRAVVKVESSQMPAHITAVTGEMLSGLAPQMPLWERVMVRNRWLFGPFLIHNLEATPNGNALVRTTTAVTMFNAGVKDNVLAAKAQAVINFRILPGDTSASVTEHIQRVIADDRVEISQFGADMREASPVSPVKGESYNILRSTVQGFFPDAVVTPNLLVATTDSSRYYALSDNVYKFFPMVRDAADMERIHGLNERLGVQDYLKSVRFMTQLMADESSQP